MPVSSFCIVVFWTFIRRYQLLRWIPVSGQRWGSRYLSYPVLYTKAGFYLVLLMKSLFFQNCYLLSMKPQMVHTGHRILRMFCFCWFIFVCLSREIKDKFQLSALLKKLIHSCPCILFIATWRSLSFWKFLGSKGMSKQSDKSLLYFNTKYIPNGRD